MTAKPTAVLIADGLLWETGSEFCPGAALPGAAPLLTATLRTHRVVVVSPSCSTVDGAKRCRGVVEQLGFGLGSELDLHVSHGFPLFDKLIAAGCCDG